MDNLELSEKVRRLSDENERLKLTFEEIRTAIAPFVQNKKPSMARAAEQQLVHDVRNVLNELGLLRALVPDDEPGDAPAR